MVKINYDNNSNLINIITSFSEKERCMAIPGGRWVPSIRAWQYLLTPSTASSICQSFGSLLSAEDREKLSGIVNRLNRAQAIKAETADLNLPVSNISAWKHQLVSYNMAKTLLSPDNGSSFGAGAMLALDMGCGKSKVAIDLITNHPEQIQKVLIVCPASVIDVWSGNEDMAGEFEKHATSEQFQKCLIIGVKGKDLTKKTKKAEFARQAALHQGKQFIAIINYESAWREPFASWVKEVKFNLIVLDEIHRIKSPGGKTSKFFGQIAKTAKYRLGLTGTPLPHSPLDIYGQYRFLDPGIFGTSFTKFRSDYALMGGFQGHQVVGYRNHEQLHNKMFLIAHRVMSKDVFDLPEFQPTVRTCELSPKEMVIYDQMDKTFCAEVKSGMVTAANALVKLLRLQEITSGFLDGQQIGDSKKKLLADVLEDFEINEPIVICARFTNDLRMIKEVVLEAGRTYGELSGRQNDLSQWQTGNCDILGVQIKSGREGVDLTRARYTIMYSLGFSYGDYEQFIKRFNRPGQKRAGMYIHLLAQNTVDFKVMKALEKRQEVIVSVLQQYTQ